MYQIFESLLDTLQPRDPEGGAASPHSTAHSPLPDVVEFLVDECKLLEWIVTLGSWEYVRPSSKTFQVRPPPPRHCCVHIYTASLLCLP